MDPSSSSSSGGTKPGCIPQPRMLLPVLEEQGTYTNLLPPSSFPSPRDGAEHGKGSSGYRTTTCPRLTAGSCSKARSQESNKQISLESNKSSCTQPLGSLAFRGSHSSGRWKLPLAELWLVPEPWLGCRDPTMRSPGTTGLSTHTDTLQPRTWTSTSTHSEAQNTTSSTNTSFVKTIPMALCRGGPSSNPCLSALLTNEPCCRLWCSQITIR